jgi:hypothetical protein
MKITVTWKDPTHEALDIQGAGFIIQEGFLAIYPDTNSGSCTLYPASDISKVDIVQEESDGKVVPIRRGN